MSGSEPPFNSRPRLLDLFCGAGGAAVGYHRAGFDVTGVDIVDQPRYPFTFHLGDATTWPLTGYDAIHASPPCQAYSRMRHLPWLKDRDYPRLLAITWQRLEANGTPWVIENVEDAPMPHSTVLCGWSLGLPIYRHRRFGSSILIMSPPHRKHEHVIAPGRMFGARQRIANESGFIADPTFHGAGRNSPELRAAMGIDWMKREEMAQAIPPAFTEYIGEQLIGAVTANVE